MGRSAWGTLNSGSSIIATQEWLGRDWGPHKCTFPGCGFNARAKGSGLAWLALCEPTEGRMLRIWHGQGEMCSHDA
ncbi:hypothetical protein CRG98_017682 [Punica granatum]|uniref:Uncharacterized protein n=1 Tax=Punica granatum TaxID=22663 RepID=A0A2I0K2M9_PUNGR|nr:hypothetical protein CRG98_017682 [Punica granatum]